MGAIDVDIHAAREFACAAVLATGQPLRDGFGVAPYTNKSQSAADVVTHLDIETEERLGVSLLEFDRGIGIHGEELGGGGAEAATYWLIDPIDGTGHFVRGTPFCTTMVALIHHGRPIVAVINDFVRGKLYAASLGGGATVNGERIQVSARSLPEAYLTSEMNLGTERAVASLVWLQQNAIVMATLACGFDFAMIAEGRWEGRIVHAGYGKDYDYAPGSLLVAEAGGIVTNLGCTGYDFRNHDFVAANRPVHAALTGGDHPVFPVIECTRGNAPSAGATQTVEAKEPPST